jgi:hypothetical protein
MLDFKKIKEILENNLVFKKSTAKKELYIKVFFSYYLNRKDYKDIKLTKQRKEEIRNRCYKVIYDYILENYRDFIDKITDILNKQGYFSYKILKNLMNKYLKIKDEEVINMLLDTFYKIFKRQYSIYSLKYPYAYPEKKNKIFFKEKKDKKIFEKVFSSIISIKEKTNKILKGKLTKQLEKYLPKEKIEMILKILCEETNFICDDKFIIIKRNKKNLEIVKNFIDNLKKQNQQSFYFKDIKKQFDMSSNVLSQVLKKLEKENKIKKVWR